MSRGGMPIGREKGRVRYVVPLPCTEQSQQRRSPHHLHPYPPGRHPHRRPILYQRKWCGRRLRPRRRRLCQLHSQGSHQHVCCSRQVSGRRKTQKVVHSVTLTTPSHQTFRGRTGTPLVESPAPSAIPAPSARRTVSAPRLGGLSLCCLRLGLVWRAGEGHSECSL